MLLFYSMHQTLIEGPITNFGFTSFDEMLENLAPVEGHLSPLANQTFLKNLYRAVAKGEPYMFFAENQIYAKDVRYFCCGDEVCKDNEDIDRVTFRLARPARYAEQQSIGHHKFKLCVQYELPDVEYACDLYGKPSIIVPDGAENQFMTLVKNFEPHLIEFNDSVKGISARISGLTLITRLIRG